MDSYGRMNTITDSDGYTRTLDYDAMDRPTKTTYPDATFEETVYERLDPVRVRDRLGRWSHRTYNAPQKGVKRCCRSAKRCQCLVRGRYGNPGLSGPDEKLADYRKMPSYVGDPLRNISRYDPATGDYDRVETTPGKFP